MTIFFKEIEKCTISHGEVLDGESGGHLEPKDYTYYLLFVTVYLLVLIVMYMFFFKTELRRTNAGSIRKPPRNLSFAKADDKDIESLLHGGMTVVRVVSPRKRLVTC